MKRPVLVVEDDTDIRELILLHLGREGHEVISATDGENALKLLEPAERLQTYSLIVLDWMLPGVSGLELCKKIQQRVPVLMVTARADSADIIAGLEAGADDYVTKPFEIGILLARVRALLRRSASRDEPDPKRFEVGALVLDAESHDVRCAGETIALTASEFKLLHGLLQNRGRALSREQLIRLVQGEGIAVTDRTVDTHVFGLRKKLGPCGDLIETIRGVGYRVKA